MTQKRPLLLYQWCVGTTSIANGRCRTKGLQLEQRKVRIFPVTAFKRRPNRLKPVAFQKALNVALIVEDGNPVFAPHNR